MTRSIPKIAVDLVARFEGCKLTAYRDIVGVLTIGYGSTGPHVKPGLTITTAAAKALLADDLKIAAARLEARIGAVVNDLSNPQFAALLSFVFNLGADPSWTIWKVLKAREFAKVPSQLLRFVNAGGKRVEGLVNRRMAEAALWSSASQGADAPPSSMTRSTPTPPTPTDDAKPLAASKTMWTGVATAVSGAAAGATQIQQVVAPHAMDAELLGKISAGIATLVVGLGVTIVVIRWLDERSKRR